MNWSNKQQLSKIQVKIPRNIHMQTFTCHTNVPCTSWKGRDHNHEMQLHYGKERSLAFLGLQQQGSWWSLRNSCIYYNVLKWFWCKTDSSRWPPSSHIWNDHKHLHHRNQIQLMERKLKNSKTIVRKYPRAWADFITAMTWGCNGIPFKQSAISSTVFPWMYSSSNSLSYKNSRLIHNATIHRDKCGEGSKIAETNLNSAKMGSHSAL